MNCLQQSAFDNVRSGKNLFLTGPAGTGKSYTLKHIIKWAKEHGLRIGVTASTGLAAFLVQGKTIHSYLGIGLANKTPEALAAYVKKNKPVYDKLRSLDILVIDEISMIDAELFGKISDFLSIIRNNPNPFGNIQMILTGDFCQLPPVNGTFCFNGALWKELDITTVVLTELTRQADDMVFQDILQEVRWGECSEKTLKTLKALKNTTFEHGILPTRLYAMNKDVDKLNKEEYDSLINAGAPAKQYTTQLSQHSQTQQWVTSLRVPELVEICVGAQVMVTWNISDCVFNGTRGVVVGVYDEYVSIKCTNGSMVTIEYVKVSCEDNDKVYVKFMPLKLAYAISIHKSQGMTLDAVEMDLGGSIFEYGQAYTALSRAKTLQSIRLVNVTKKSFKCHPLVKEFYTLKNFQHE